MVELSPLLLPLLQPLIPMEELLHLWSPSLLLLLWTHMAALRLFQLRSSRTTLCWPSTMTTTPTTCLPTRWVEKDGPNDLEMTLPHFRLHPSHLTHMARAWTRSPELSRSLQTTPSRCSKRPLQGLLYILEAFIQFQDSYGQPVEAFGAPVLTDAPVVVTSSDNLSESEAFGVPVPVGTSAPGFYYGTSSQL